MHQIFPVIFQHQRYLAKELNEVLAKHDLYHAQFTILYMLYEQQTLTLTAMWKYLNVEAPTVTRTVSRLEQIGYVQRVEGADKREKMVELTTLAKKEMPAIIEDIESFEQRMLSRLTTEEIDNLEQILKKMKGD